MPLTCTRRSDVRHDEDENVGDNYFIIFNRDLVRDQDEVYIYDTLMEYINTLLNILPTLTGGDGGGALL